MKSYLLVVCAGLCSTLLADAKSDQEKLTGIMKEFHGEMDVFRNDKGHYIVRLNKKVDKLSEYPLANLYWSPDGRIFNPIEKGSSGPAEGGGARIDIHDNHHVGPNKRTAELIENKTNIALNCGPKIVGGEQTISSDFKPVKDPSVTLANARFSPNARDRVAGFIISKTTVGDEEQFVLAANARFAYPFRSRESFEKTYNKVFVGTAGKMKEWMDPSNPELGVGNISGNFALGDQSIPSGPQWTGKGAKLRNSKGELAKVDLEMDWELQSVMNALDDGPNPEEEIDPAKLARFKEVVGPELYARLQSPPIPFPCDPFVPEGATDPNKPGNH